MEKSIYYESELKDIFLIGITKVAKDKLIGLQYNSNRLYEVDLRENKIEYLQEIPIWETNVFKLFQTSIMHGCKIYFLPFNSSNMAIYSINTKSIELIKIQQFQGEYKYGRCMNGFVIEDTLIMIPYGAKKILHFDMRICQVTGECSLDGIINDDDLFYSYTQDYDGKLILPSMTSNTVVFYDIKHKYAISKEIGQKDSGYSGIALLDNDLYLLLKDKPGIIKYNLLNQQSKLIDNMPKGFESVKGSFFDAKNVYCINGRMLCFPGNGNMAIEIDLISEEVNEIKSLTKLCEEKYLATNKFIFDGGVISENKIYLYYQDNSIVEYDIDTRNILMHRLKNNVTRDCIKFLMIKTS